MSTPRAWSNEAGEFVDRHQRLLACLLSFVLLVLLHDTYNIAEFPYDAAEYWDLARPSVIPVYASPRGYFFPLLLLPLRSLADYLLDPVTVIRVGMSLLYAVLLPLAIPAAFQQAFGGKVTFLRRLVPVVLLVLVFPGVLVYPLTDLPAALLTLGSVYAVLRAVQQSRRSSAIALLVAAGAMSGAGYYTRTIYAVAVPALLLFVLVIAGRHRADLRLPRWLAVLAAATGIVLAGLPQLAINQQARGVMSLAVYSDVERRSLFTSQLVWGITLQRYETTLATDVAAPTVFYLDPAGERLFKAAMQRGDLFSFPHYLRTVLTHPLDFAALYSRHLVNGLDVRDGIVYTRKPSPLRTRTALLNFSVLMLAFWVACSWWARRGQAPAGGFQPAGRHWPFALAVVLMPVAIIIPGAVESRFFLPLHLLAYGVIAFQFDAAELRRRLRSHKVLVVVGTLVLGGVFFAITLSTMAQMQHDWPQLYRHGP